MFRDVSLDILNLRTWERAHDRLSSIAAAVGCRPPIKESKRDTNSPVTARLTDRIVVGPMLYVDCIERN
jgi:hypothetical protein